MSGFLPERFALPERQELPDLVLPAAARRAAKRLESELPVQSGEVGATNERVAVQPHGLDVAPRDRARERLGEGLPLDRLRGADREPRELDAALLRLEAGFLPDPRRKREERRDTARGESGGAVIQRFFPRGHTMGPRADSAAEARPRFCGALFSFHGDKGVLPGLLRRTGERAERMEGPEGRSGREGRESRLPGARPKGGRSSGTPRAARLRRRPLRLRRRGRRARESRPRVSRPSSGARTSTESGRPRRFASSAFRAITTALPPVPVQERMSARPARPGPTRTRRSPAESSGITASLFLDCPSRGRYPDLALRGPECQTPM